MHLRRSVLLLALLPLTLLIGCFGVSIDASAEVSGGRFLTPAETIEFYGNSIPCTYYNGSNFVTVNLKPTSNYTYHFAESSTRYETTDYITSSLSWVMYYSTVDVSDYVSNPNYLNIDITPNLTVSGCSDFYAAVATRCSTNGGSSQSNQPSVSASAYDSSFFDISAAGQTLRFSNSLLTTQDNSQYLCPCMTRDGLSSYWSCLYVPVEWHTSTLSTVSTLRAGFYGATRNAGGNSGRFEVYLSCPYVNPIEANVETGVVTGTTAPSSGDINVNVDLTETNSWLENIFDGISNIGSALGNAISALFLPDEEDIVNWKQTIVNILNETFGGIPELEQSLKDAISSIFSASALETVTFEGIKVPAAAGEPEAVIVPRQEVRLKPNGFDNLFSWVEMFINIVATIAIANTCFNQVKRVIVGEVVVDAD